MVDVPRLIEQNKAGNRVGLPSFCTANEEVLRAILDETAGTDRPIVIEATCNQVNQDGGYTGMKPQDFASWIKELCSQHGTNEDQILLGGDYLGPNPWRQMPAGEAMEHALELVRAYAQAGFRKIHLDASMSCGGEPTPSFAEVANRAAQLCKVVEENAPAPDELVYVIGTEVPIPGGETDDMSGISITTVDRLQDTVDTHKEAFERLGLSHVSPKIVSVVTQPGVDFSHTSVHPFIPGNASHLTKSIADFSGLTFEAHSTDYQPDEALAALVDNHFFFLKVGPELTFRMREAVFGLARIEDALRDSGRSAIVELLEKEMLANSEYWASYYKGNDAEQRLLRQYSYSDRIRYYWSVPEIRKSLATMRTNLAKAAIPEGLISQNFPARPFGQLTASPERLVRDHIGLSINRYYAACGY
jgi:D-tagatose-1,6-bisphosphate aldolase subunit GatZ/KbaZ